MLVDVVHEVGLDGMAQVDLGRRVHRNSPDDALCRMAGQVYLAMLSRLERHGRALPTVDRRTDLTQFARDRGAFVPLGSSTSAWTSGRRCCDLSAVPPPVGPRGFRMSLPCSSTRGPGCRCRRIGYGGIETVVATLVPELRRLGVGSLSPPSARARWRSTTSSRRRSAPRASSPWRALQPGSGIAHAHMHGGARLRCGTTRRSTSCTTTWRSSARPCWPPLGDQAPPTLQTLHWDLRKHADFYGGFDGRGRVASRQSRSRSSTVLPTTCDARQSASCRWRSAAAGRGGRRAGDHALVLARITADKAQDVAARVARQRGVPWCWPVRWAGIDDADELERRLGRRRRRGWHRTPTSRFFVDRVRPLVDGEPGHAGSAGWPVRRRSGCCSRPPPCSARSDGPSPAPPPSSRRWPAGSRSSARPVACCPPSSSTGSPATSRHRGGPRRPPGQGRRPRSRRVPRCGGAVDPGAWPTGTSTSTTACCRRHAVTHELVMVGAGGVAQRHVQVLSAIPSGRRRRGGPPQDAACALAQRPAVPRRTPPRVRPSRSAVRTARLRLRAAVRPRRAGARGARPRPAAVRREALERAAGGRRGPGPPGGRGRAS